MGERVAMVVFSEYPWDSRVRRAAEALREDGMEVHVFCLRSTGKPRRDTHHEVGITRLPVTRRRGGRVRYVYEYAAFTFLAALAVTAMHLRRRLSLVHVHNMPDLLVFSALVARAGGARVILDLHDPMPEVFQTKYTLEADHWLPRLLRWSERRSIRFADGVITPNRASRDLFVDRGCPPDKIAIVMNAPEEKIFQPAAAATHDPERFALMYHGFIAQRHGLDLLLQALVDVRRRIPHVHLGIYGDGDGFLDTMLAMIPRLGLEDVVTYHGYRTQDHIARAIQESHLGIIPNRRTCFTELNLPTRILEYLSLGKPVICPRTRGVRDYFDDDSILFFEAGDPCSLARCILRVHDEPDRVRGIVARGQAVYQAHTWSTQKSVLIDSVHHVLTPPTAPNEEVHSHGT